MATDMQQQAQGNPQLLAQRLQQLKVSQARQSQQSNSTPPRGATDSSLADPRSDSDEDEHSPDKPSSPAARSPQQHQQQRAAARAHAAAVLPPATAGPDAAAAAAAAMHNPPPVADGLMTTAPAAPAAAAASGGSACRLEYFQPHDGYGKGCPAPPCFEERVGTALGIHRKMELRDGELGEALFGLSVALLCARAARRARHACACRPRLCTRAIRCVSLPPPAHEPFTSPPPPPSTHTHTHTHTLPRNRVHAAAAVQGV
jgi:hypothetical protein